MLMWNAVDGCVPFGPWFCLKCKGSFCVWDTSTFSYILTDFFGAFIFCAVNLKPAWFSLVGSWRSLPLYPRSWGCWVFTLFISHHIFCCLWCLIFGRSCFDPLLLIRIFCDSGLWRVLVKVWPRFNQVIMSSLVTRQNAESASFASLERLTSVVRLGVPLVLVSWWMTARAVSR